MSESLHFFATVPKGMEALLAAELRELGASAVDAGRAGVAFRGSLETAYRACLWSRLASRILMPLGRFPAPNPEALHAGIYELPWEEHLAPEGTLAVDFNTAQSQINHSHFGALKVKDGVVDRFRDRFGVRPSVARQRPDLRINVYLHRDVARVSLDLSGESLHRRGYREEGALAPLKENLAAAILLRAGWPRYAARGEGLLDPMCGSGTLLIEAALMAGDVAPGLYRDYFGFLGWKGHRDAVWTSQREEAEERRRQGLEHLPPLVGYDVAAAAVRGALANIDKAGLRGKVHVERRDLTAIQPPAGAPSGLLAVNPPYGERLGEEKDLILLYARLGELVRRSFSGWGVAVFTGNPRLGLRLGVPVQERETFYNGALECQLLLLAPAASGPAAKGADMLANRLRKNLKHLGRWARRSGVDCYRLYDADLPEYALAVDLYQRDGERWAHAQEYAPPATIDPEVAEERLRLALAAISEVLELPADRVFLKIRRRQKGAQQYEKTGESGGFFEVREGNCRLLVNFTDYLDTGLFLDHRTTRQVIGEMAEGRRFLNLFGYTGAATVHAARGGAVSTTTVDMSRTYLDWARRNLALNGLIGGAHELVQADCLDWLARQAKGPGRGQYDLIFLDPPTFSNSKRMEGTFDVQRDHPDLIRQAVSLLAPRGTLIFSNNFRKFRLDTEALPGLEVEDFTAATIPPDFARNPRIHQCWRIAVLP